MTSSDDLTRRHATGRMMLSLAGARQVAAAFRALGGFSEVRISEFGYASGCYEVHLWSVSARAGNRTLTAVAHVPATAKEYQILRKQALGKATAADAAALSRAAAARAMDAE